MNDYNELIERLAVSAGDQECLYSDAKEAMAVLLCAYKSVAKQLHDAEDVLKQNILNEFARIGVIDGQPGWIQHYCHERKEVVKDPLTLDGELHCTILPAVEALKAERDSLQSRVAELESRLEISPLHNVDGIMARDATIKLQDERIAELEAERAEREKQEPIGRIFFPKHRKAPDVHWADNTPILEGAAIYAAPPVTAPVRLTDRDKDGLAVPYSGMGGIEDYRAYAQDIEAASLRANGFKVEE